MRSVWRAAPALAGSFDAFTANQRGKFCNSGPLVHPKIVMLRTSFLTACLLACSGFAAGQENRPVRRLETVTWNPTNHKLTWTVTDGKKEGSKIVYEIDMDAATMSLNGEDRRFSRDEAVRVHALMNVVARYAAESTVWWEAGEGVPVTKDDKSKPERKHSEEERQEPRRRPREERPPRGVVPISFPAQQMR